MPGASIIGGSALAVVSTSITTSAPLPLVSSRMASAASCERQSTVTNAPASRATEALSCVETVAITSAPDSLAIWIA